MRNRRSVAVLGTATGLLLFAQPQLAAAMEQTFDFSGYLTQQTISPGTLIPPGFQIPQTFSGSFLYDSSAPAPNVISDVLVDFGTFQIAKNISGAGAGHTFFTPTSVAFEDTSSLGLSGLDSGLGLNGFYLTFSETSGGAPIDPATLDFSKFPTASLNLVPVICRTAATSMSAARSRQSPCRSLAHCRSWRAPCWRCSWC